MDESKKISVSIAGRNYPIIIAPKEEQKIKDIELNLKSKYLQSTSDYPKLDAQDHLAMVILSLMMEKSEEVENIDDIDMSEKINNLITKIENHLD